MTAFKDAPKAGHLRALEPGIQTILAPNPSPMTYWGTNTYLVGHSSVAVIDPGPDDPAHLRALRDGIGSRDVSHILVTHSHLDHSPLARPLAAATGARIYAFGDSTAGRSEAMTQLAQTGEIGGGEGVDPDFAPDELLADGDVITGDGWALQALHTPGHFGNHMCFAGKDYVFTGDHVMAWATSLVSPPDGDLTDFMSSCHKLAGSQWRAFYPGHGAPVLAPNERLNWLINHRMGREADILSALAEGPSTANELARKIYTETPPALLPAATRNVLAHLIDLMGKHLIAAQGPLAHDCAFELLDQTGK